MISRANLGGVIQPRRRPPAVDDAGLRDLAGRYAGGASMRTLVSDTGWAYGTVHRRLHLAIERGILPGVRPKGGARVDSSARPAG